MIEFFQEIANAEITYPPILRLKFNTEGLVLEDGALEDVKKYSNNIIEMLINNETK